MNAKSIEKSIKIGKTLVRTRPSLACGVSTSPLKAAGHRLREVPLCAIGEVSRPIRDALGLKGPGFPVFFGESRKFEPTRRLQHLHEPAPKSCG